MNSTDAAYLYYISSEQSWTTVLFSVLSGLAVADSYLIERNGYQYAVMARSDKMRYCLSEVGAAVLSGILTVLLARLLVLAGIIAIVGILHGEIHFGDILLQDVGLHRPSWCLSRGSIILYICQLFLYDILYASIFPAFSLVVSVFVRNRYIPLFSL